MRRTMGNDSTNNEDLQGERGSVKRINHLKEKKNKVTDANTNLEISKINSIFSL